MNVVTVLGGGPVALAYALFAARYGPVRLAARPGEPQPGVESVPAATLALLVELGVVPGELGVERLTRCRVVAWEQAQPRRQPSPACAQLDRAALVRALRSRIARCPDVTTVGPHAPRLGRVVDATGRRAVTAHTHVRPGRPWVAATCTVARDGRDPTMHLAASPDGYAYRLGAERLLTVGWVAPGAPPRDGAALGRRLGAAAPWLVEDLSLPRAPTARRVASVSLPQGRPGSVLALGDAALTRDALASQGTSIGLSDACLAATAGGPDRAAAVLAERAGAGRVRHLEFLGRVLAACVHRDAPVWSAYRDRVATLATSTGT